MSWQEKSQEAWNNAWKSKNIGNSISAGISGITGIASAGINNAQIKDTSSIENSINDTANAEFGYADYDTLLSSYNNGLNLQNGNYSRKDVRGTTFGQSLLNTGKGMLSGAAAGATLGGPYGAIAGAAAGLISGTVGNIAGEFKTNRKIKELNNLAEEANRNYLYGFARNADNIADNMFNKSVMNIAANGGKIKSKKTKYVGVTDYFAYGGELSLSGDWSNGVTIIGEGGTHENNKYEGVPIGIDPYGIPNLVEEGEVIYNDYVYSNRIKAPKKKLENVYLNTKYADKSISEIAKLIQKESSENPNDPISRNTLDDSMNKLAVLQETIKAEQEMRKLNRMLKQLPPEEREAFLAQMMSPQQPIEQGNPQQMEMESPEAMANERTPRAYNAMEEELANYGNEGAPVTGMEQPIFAYGGLKRKFGNGTPGKIEKMKKMVNPDDPTTFTNLADYNAARLKEYENKAKELLDFYNDPNSGLTEEERAQIAEQIDYLINPTTTTDPYYVFKEINDRIKYFKSTGKNGKYRPYNTEGYDLNKEEFKTLSDYLKYNDANKDNLLSVKEIEDSKSYQDFTNYILNNSDNEEVKAYLQLLDDNINPNGKVALLHDAKGNLVGNWQDLYRRRRTDGKYGLYHITPGMTQDTTPREFRYYLNGVDGADPIEINANDANNYMFVNRDGQGNYYYNRLPKAAPETSPKVAPEDPTKTKSVSDPVVDDLPQVNWMTYAPAIGSGLATLGDLLGNNRPDYTNLNVANRARRNIRNIRGSYVGPYMTYNPFDTNYEQNKVINQGLNTKNGILASTSGNRSAAIASLMALNNSTNAAMGDTYRKGLEYNDVQRKAVTDFNRSTDVQNATFSMQAQQANSNIDSQKAQLAYTDANYRNTLANSLAGVRAANASNFYNNLGNVGKTKYASDQYNWLLSRGWMPNSSISSDAVKAARGGKVCRKKKKGLTY